MNKVLDSLHKRKENSICFDCYEKGTNFVNVTLGTFVCTKCAGLLRDLNYSVKGLGVSIIKDKEVAKLEEMGNENAWNVWLAKFRDIKGVYPNSNDMLQLQEHLKEKYVLKRFYMDTDKVSTKDNSYHSYKSCEVKKTRSETNSVNDSNINVFNETDFRFDNQSETAKPSKFKKFSSATITSSLKIETNQNNQSGPGQNQNQNRQTNIPLTSRKSDNNIVCSHPTQVTKVNTLNTSRNLENKALNLENKAFNFSLCEGNVKTTPNIYNVSTNPTVLTAPTVSSAPVIIKTNSATTDSFPLTHDFTKGVKIMDSLNSLYSGYNPEKKVDPLDKLFYQYNFTSGNHMRMSGNNFPGQGQIPSYNNMYSNGNGCMYPIHR